jgi:hypothetical protein
VRFVHRDAHQPGIKLRVALELVELLVRLQERVLHHILGVFAVLNDVLRNAKNLAIVLLHQLLVRRYIAPPRPLHEQDVRMNFGRSL